MSIKSISSSFSLNNTKLNTQNNQRSNVKKPFLEKVFSSDNLKVTKEDFQVKRGVWQTAKGIGAGAFAGTVVGGATMGMQTGGHALGVLTGAVQGIVGGAVIGGLVTNLTDNKLLGTAAGAITGAAAMSISQMEFTPSFLLTGAAIGGASGFAASLVATKQ